MREFKLRRERVKDNKNWQEDVKKMHEDLAEEGIQNPMMEIYSPTRVTGMADQLGLIKGMALDLTVVDEDDGKPWDFNKSEKKAKPGEWWKAAMHCYLLGVQCAQHSHSCRT